MRYLPPCLALLVPLSAALPAADAIAAADAAADARVIAEATHGQFVARKGKYFEKSCNETLDYRAEVIDLNGDGQPEVFINVDGTCMGGMTGVFMNLYIKDRHGHWQPQFGFPGIYNILKSRNRGYPDIEIGGPGFCFPIWRWNGSKYALYKHCRNGHLQP